MKHGSTAPSYTQILLRSLQGVAAKAISGNTDAGVRRHYVEQFNAGKIRVLTTYGVLGYRRGKVEFGDSAQEAVRSATPNAKSRAADDGAGE